MSTLVSSKPSLNSLKIHSQFLIYKTLGFRLSLFWIRRLHLFKECLDVPIQRAPQFKMIQMMIQFWFRIQIKSLLTMIIEKLLLTCFRRSNEGMDNQVPNVSFTLLSPSQISSKFPSIVEVCGLHLSRANHPSYNIS